ncbi:UNKNOWN [Stylonychia lemnae]|uniref:Uncharacterized protein n=1 Tax=Stylonychia lemnae TaxID=5949 RepID=A0A077ZNT0_STYLE|nr:UNKNOWN [Stylonychia lemnae]|eukprot:CDW71622.1 UNKNOWN [Stylonychia lemnae]
MNAIISMIATALASFNLKEEFQAQVFYMNYDPLNKPISDKIQFLQEVWIAANELGFCIYPAAVLHSALFINPYLETIGIDERFKHVVSPERLKTGFKHMDKPSQDQIPYVSHHVWLTNPKNPKEMLSQTDGYHLIGYDFHLNVTYTTLTKHNFTTYLWTNKIDAIPETQKWAQKQGIIMRELSEFESMEEHRPVLEEIDRAIEQKNYAGGADIARLLILYEIGGLYTDQDHQIIQYDPLLNKLNLFFYEYTNVGYHTIENSMIGASPKNKYILEAMRAIIRTRQGEVIPHFESICLQQSERYIHFVSGPQRMSRVFNQMLINGDLDDQLYLVLDEKITFDGWDYTNSRYGKKYNDVVFKDGTHRLSVQFRHLPTGTWMDRDKELNMYGWQNKKQ